MSEKELTQGVAYGQRTSWRRWLWLGLLLCVFALAWATPWLLKWQLVHQLQKALQRPVAVQSLVLHPWSLSVEVNGVSVANRHGGELLGWGRLYLKASAQSWHERAAVLDDVQLHGLRVTATRLSDGRYDFEDLLQPQESSSDAATRYAVHSLNLHQARVAWRDVSNSDVHTLAQLSVKGHVQALTGAPQGEFDVTLNTLELAQLQTALALALPVTVQEGEASAQLHIQWAQPANVAPEVKVSGQVAMADMSLHDAQGQMALTLNALQLQIDALDVKQRTLGLLSLQNGSLRLRDERVQPAFTLSVTGLSGTVKGLSALADTQADLQLSGVSSGNAPVNIQARLNPLAPEKFLELRAKVSNLELPRFSGYMGKYAGYAIEKGKGTMDVTYRLRNGKLQGENHVFIDQLTLGERVESPDATDLPVSLAIALLKNRQGQIELDLPVAGSMDDPQFSLRQLIGRAVWNLVSKVVASPWTFLQSMFGGDETLSQAVFAPGSAALDASARQTLDQLARAMHERPALTLEVRGVVDAVRDAPAVAYLPKDEAARQDAFISLAQRRAQAVQRSLVDNGKVSPERVFVLAPKPRHADMPTNAGVVFTLR